MKKNGDKNIQNYFQTLYEFALMIDVIQKESFGCSKSVKHNMNKVVAKYGWRVLSLEESSEVLSKNDK